MIDLADGVAGDGARCSEAWDNPLLLVTASLLALVGPNPIAVLGLRAFPFEQPMLGAAA